jgi:hypothetical protein
MKMRLARRERRDKRRDRRGKHEPPLINADNADILNHKGHSAAKLQSKNKISTADYTDVADLHDTDKEILLPIKSRAKSASPV